MGTLEWPITLAIIIGALLLTGLAFYAIHISRSLSRAQGEMRGWAESSQELSKQARSQADIVSALVERTKLLPETLQSIENLKQTISTLNRHAEDVLGETRMRNTKLDDLIKEGKNLQDTLDRSQDDLKHLIEDGNELSKSVMDLINMGKSLLCRIEIARNQLQEESKSLQGLAKDFRTEFERYQHRIFEIALIATILLVISVAMLVFTNTMEDVMISLFAASLVTFLIQLPQIPSWCMARTWLKEGTLGKLARIFYRLFKFIIARFSKICAWARQIFDTE